MKQLTKSYREKQNSLPSRSLRKQMTSAQPRKGGAGEGKRDDIKCVRFTASVEDEIAVVGDREGNDAELMAVHEPK
ncbi:hypothetical protein RIF29_19748 [Crotalaria pallida]|uniref:Uncharacterized protein n=1 Tax=Crotalaria pallida TaxID=3830 RepID=A0AAN9I6T2_CROPI